MAEILSQTGTDDDETFLRTEFLERVAHELRGPAGVTLGALDELALVLANPTPESMTRMIALLAMARRGTQKVLRTAERLSRAARLESASVAIARTIVDLRDVVRRATDDASTLEARTRVAIHVELPDEPCPVDIDADWMTSAITELVGHAIRAARRSVSVSVAALPGRVRVAITDDRGFAPDVVRKRFSPSSPRRDVGLGIPMVYDVVRLHGAAIEVEELRSGADSARSGVSVRLFVPVPIH